MGAFGLLDFTMLRPVLAWHEFRNFWTVYFFNFPFFGGGPGKLRIRGSACFFVFLCCRGPTRAMVSTFLMLLDHTAWRTTANRTPLHGCFDDRKWWTGEDMERCGLDTTQDVIPRLDSVTEENHETPHWGWHLSRPEFESGISPPKKLGFAKSLLAFLWK